MRVIWNGVNHNMKPKKRHLLKPPEVNFKAKLLILFVIILLLFNMVMYALDKSIMGNVMTVACAQSKVKLVEIMNKTILDVCSNEFNYDEIIKADKDSQGNIVMLKADTMKMNKIACDVSLEAQKKMKEYKENEVDIPLGYITKNNLLSNVGPSIKVKTEPIGYIETSYLSTFESAGINQTRHKIYVQVKSTVRVIIPLHSQDIQIVNQVPVAETIIVGKVPNNAINFDMNSVGTKLLNEGQ